MDEWIDVAIYVIDWGLAIADVIIGIVGSGTVVAIATSLMGIALDIAEGFGLIADIGRNYAEHRKTSNDKKKIDKIRQLQKERKEKKLKAKKANIKQKAAEAFA